QHVAVSDLLSITFFFSSRRRHTRLVSDWSSDVCSSDLGLSQEAASSPQSAPSRTISLNGCLATLVCAQLDPWHSCSAGNACMLRSEERRVGKECRARGWAGREKEQMKDGRAV